MTPSDFRDQIDRLGLSTTGAARLLGVEDRSIRRYLDGTRAIPEPVRRLLWAIERDATLADALRAA